MATATEFSLIVTCYNFEEYLGECLESLIQQQYEPKNFEIICVDDGSTDGSPEIIKEYQKKSDCLIPIRLNNSGLEKACNAGIQVAHFKRVVRVDSDDMLATNFLAVMNQAILTRPDFDFYYCKNYYEYYSPNENFAKILPDFDVEEIFKRGDFFATGTVYQKKDLAQIGFFPEGIKNCGLENYSVILAMLEDGKKGLAVPGTFFSYRRHKTNMSTLRRQSIIEYGKKLLRKHNRVFQTNPYHPYGLKLVAEETKK